MDGAFRKRVGWDGMEWNGTGWDDVSHSLWVT